MTLAAFRPQRWPRIRCIATWALKFSSAGRTSGASTSITSKNSRSGMPTRSRKPTAAHRPCSSWCATTPTSARRFSTRSPATRRSTATLTARPSSRRARSRYSTMSRTSAGCTGRTPSWWTAGSSNRAKACPTISRSWPRTRSRTSRPNTAAAFPRRRRPAHAGVRGHLRRSLQRRYGRRAAGDTQRAHAEAGQGRARDPGTTA
jgi:hypothetical protein